jgi:hypothetical protein
MKEYDHDGREEVVICKGNISCKTYQGPVVLCINKKFYCPDLWVYHSGELSEFTNGHPCECEHFTQAVIQLMISEGLLESDKKYELCRAELGMQDYDYATFEWLGDEDESGIDYLRKIAVSKGCRDLGFEDKKATLEKYTEQAALIAAGGEYDNGWVKSVCFQHSLKDKQGCDLVIDSYFRKLSREELVELAKSGSFDREQYLSKWFNESVGDHILIEILEELYQEQKKSMEERYGVA